MIIIVIIIMLLVIHVIVMITITRLYYYYYYHYYHYYYYYYYYYYYGRIIDRHIKIIRYKRHPLVLAAEPIPEPLLYMLEDPKDKSKSSASRTRQAQRRRAGPRKTGIKNEHKERAKGGNTQVAPPMKGTTCPSCDSDMIIRTSHGKLRWRNSSGEWFTDDSREWQDIGKDDLR